MTKEKYQKMEIKILKQLLWDLTKERSKIKNVLKRILNYYGSLVMLIV